MKKLLVIAIMFVASIVSAQEAVVTHQDNSENFYINKPVPVIESICVDAATTDATKTITGSASVSIGTIPPGTRRIMVRALTVDVNWGMDSTVGTGELFQIAANEYKTFVGDSTELAKLYFQSQEAATSATLLVRYFER